MNRIQLSGFFRESKLVDDHGRKVMFFSLAFVRPRYGDGRIRAWLHGAVLIHRASSFRDGTEVAVTGRLDCDLNCEPLIHVYDIRAVIHVERPPAQLQPDHFNNKHRITHRDFTRGANR